MMKKGRKGSDEARTEGRKEGRKRRKEQKEWTKEEAKVREMKEGTKGRNDRKEQKAIQQAGADGNLDSIALEPGMAERLQSSLSDTVKNLDKEGKPAVLLVAASLRMLLARFVRHAVPNLKVLSFQEIPDNKHITIVATVGGQ